MPTQSNDHVLLLPHLPSQRTKRREPLQADLCFVVVAPLFLAADLADQSAEIAPDAWCLHDFEGGWEGPG